MNEQQRQIYLTARIICTLQSNEKLFSCTKCSNSDIRVLSNSEEIVPLWWCTKGCGNGHCTIFKQDLPKVKNEEKYDIAQQQILDRHLFVCAFFHKPKKMIDLAIFEGAQGQCPNCKMGGVKGAGECTHMTCNACTGQWCYVCEIAVEDCDRDNNEESIYSHNVGWQTNRKRWPMYLHQISTIDGSWSRNTVKSIERFHCIKTLNNLSKAIYGEGGMGVETYNRLCAAYNSLRCNGFVLEDIPESPIQLYRLANDPEETSEESEESDGIVVISGGIEEDSKEMSEDSQGSWDSQEMSE